MKSVGALFDLETLLGFLHEMASKNPKKLQHAVPADCIIDARDNDAVGCLSLLPRKMPWKIRRGQEQELGG